MTEKEKAALELLQRGLTVALSGKYFEVITNSEDHLEMKGKLISVIGSALGQTLDEISFPTNWQRYVKRKDCPAYLKQIKTVKAEVYYPKIALPQEEHWLTFSVSEIRDVNAEGVNSERQA